jgi:hypothetical protein
MLSVLESPASAVDENATLAIECEYGHPLVTTRGTSIDKRFQLNFRGQIHNDFKLSSGECIVCCSERKKVADYLGESMMEIILNNLVGKYITESAIAYEMKVLPSS